VLYIESTMSCIYDSGTKKVTIIDGFISKSTYVPSQIELKISNLINPNVAMTTDSFGITTQKTDGTVYDSIFTGVEVTKACNTPCATCLTDLSNCTSCFTNSDKPYLSNDTCVAS
jgi:hypothetical protein